MSSFNPTLSAPAPIPSLSSATDTAPVAVTPAAFGITDIGLLVMAVIWGVNYSVVKYGLRTVAPLSFTAIRLMASTLILLVLAALVRDARAPSRRDVMALLGIGLIGNGLYQLLFIVGLSQTRAGIAALVVAASPAWVAIISRILGRERASRRGWAGIALQLVGVASVVLSSNVMDGQRSAFLGTFLIVCGSIMWSLYSVLLQPYTERVHPLHLSAITLGSGAIMMLILASPGLMTLDVHTVGTSGWLALTYSALGAMVFAYLLYYRGIRVLGPTRTALYGNLQPVVAIGVAWFALSEAPTIWQWIGTTFIMGGLLLSRTATMKTPHE